MKIDNSSSMRQEEYVLIPTPVDYEQFMKMQYSKDFTNINSLENNIIPNNFQSKLGSGLIDSKMFNFYNQNPALDVNSIANSTAFENMNKDIYNQINNGVEQKFLIEYANKLSHESKIESPKFVNDFFPRNLPVADNKQQNINKAYGSENPKGSLDLPVNLNLIEKNSDESPIKNMKDLTSDPQKFMKMQEDQYQKYFDEINKNEYKKIYESLNNKNYEKQIYDKILNSDANIDYSEFWKNNQNSVMMPNNQGFLGNMNETNSRVNYTNEELIMLQTSAMSIPDDSNKNNLNLQNMNVISLPENKFQMEELYKNFFKNINMNNTMNGISLLQETTGNSAENKAEKEMMQYDKIEMPTRGLVNTKVQPIKHNIIGLDLNRTIENTPVVEEDPDAIRIKERREINKRLYENFPRNRNLRPYEKEDLEEKKILIQKKKLDYEKTKAKFAKGFSFMQKQNEDESKYFEENNVNNSLSHLDSLVSSNLSQNGNKMNELLKNVRFKIRNKKSKIRENLLNCKKSCKDTCNRVKSLGKNESFELCNTKCELACSNNALNLLLK